MKNCKLTKLILTVIATVMLGGPALAWLITRLIPLMDAQKAGLLLISLAPTAPFFPLVTTGLLKGNRL
jgi:predicted Na+-dependent transporter